jgi:hypothetical protein
MSYGRFSGLIFGAVAIGLAGVSVSAGTTQTAPPPAPAEQTPTGQAPTQQVPGGVTVTGESLPKTTAAGKITDPKHPDFVRCRSEAVLNSRAARVRTCRTNKEWAASSREGNRQTQELLNMGRPTQPTP